MLKAALAFSLLAACVDQAPDVEIESTERLAANALAPGYFTAANLNAATLNAANLQAMASTGAGRATLPYVIGCALPTGTSVSTTYNPPFNIPITFNGDIGLATNWQSASLSVAQQRLVSGCALARVNEQGTSVTISLRGPSSALTVKASEASGYPGFEGVFFGNVFAGALEFAACRGTATSLPTGRTCTQEEGAGETFCGYAYAGLCADACSTLVDAGTHTYYQNCTIGSTTYAEALTTYVP